MTSYEGVVVRWTLTGQLTPESKRRLARRNTKTRTVYTEQDRERLAAIQAYAESLWYDTWRSLGSPDEGSCCTGKGFRIKFLPKRKRLARDFYIARADFVQGGYSARLSSAPVAAYLAECGIDAEYFDGHLD